MEETDIRQNLLDAGCEIAMVSQICGLLSCGNQQEALKLIAKHRKKLLADCHAREKKIEYLDYLVYQLENKS